MLPLIIVLFAVPLFMGTRKQKRAAAAQQQMQSSLSYGDRVMTTSGLYGTVVTTSDESIDLEIAPGVVTSWLRAAVREKVADSTVDLPEDATTTTLTTTRPTPTMPLTPRSAAPPTCTSRTRRRPSRVRRSPRRSKRAARGSLTPV